MPHNSPLELLSVLQVSLILLRCVINLWRRGVCGVILVSRRLLTSNWLRRGIRGVVVPRGLLTPNLLCSVGHVAPVCHAHAVLCVVGGRIDDGVSGRGLYHVLTLTLYNLHRSSILRRYKRN